MNNETTKKGNTVKIWTGPLRLNADRKKEGDEVDARIVLTGSSVIFEIIDVNTGDWRIADPAEIYAPSWLRALGATGSEAA